MRLFQSQMVLRGKITSLLTRGVHFLDCPFIRDFTAFVSFPFSRVRTGYQYSFSRETSLLVFVVPKTVLSFWYGGWWLKWNWRNVALFYLSEGKYVRCQQDHIHTFIISAKYLIRVSFSQTIRKWGHNNLGTCHPEFLAILQRYRSYLQNLLEV